MLGGLADNIELCVFESWSWIKTFVRVEPNPSFNCNFFTCNHKKKPNHSGESLHKTFIDADKDVTCTFHHTYHSDNPCKNHNWSKILEGRIHFEPSTIFSLWSLSTDYRCPLFKGNVHRTNFWQNPYFSGGFSPSISHEHNFRIPTPSHNSHWRTVQVKIEAQAHSAKFFFW